MARRAGLALATGVLAAHLAALDWFAGALDHGSVLQQRADPMFTRLLLPQQPPEPLAAPVARAVPRAPAPAREGSIAASLPDVSPVASMPDAHTPTVVAETPPQPPVTIAAEPAPAAPAAPVPPADTEADRAVAVLDSWPTDTRLNYRLSGFFRGELHGDARVQWQRDGASYQVRLDIAITPFVTLAMTSQGEVGTEGLMPRAFEEVRPDRRRATRFGERAIELEGGRSAPRPAGVQDTASQFVELAHRFATGRAELQVGKAVSFWMARPGAVDFWTYDVVARETLQLAKLGAVEAFHLKPRPIANPRGNITAEMWFAPSLQYLPVRIRVNMGDEAHVDLLVEAIEQR